MEIIIMPHDCSKIEYNMAASRALKIKTKHFNYLSMSVQKEISVCPNNNLEKLLFCCIQIDG